LQKLPAEQERVPRATRSAPAVGGTGHAAARSTTSISPSQNVDSGLSGSQSSASLTWACNQCSKIFNRRENLSRHLKTRKLAEPSRLYYLTMHVHSNSFLSSEPLIDPC
jgi:hypothetical protein